MEEDIAQQPNKESFFSDAKKDQLEFLKRKKMVHLTGVSIGVINFILLIAVVGVRQTDNWLKSLNNIFGVPSLYAFIAIAFFVLGLMPLLLRIKNQEAKEFFSQIYDSMVFGIIFISTTLFLVMALDRALNFNQPGILKDIFNFLTSVGLTLAVTAAIGPWIFGKYEEVLEWKREWPWLYQIGVTIFFSFICFVISAHIFDSSLKI